MAVRSIASIGHPVLRQIAKEVSKAELATPSMQAFIDDLVETMHAAHGAGLAANQVHAPVRICAVHVQNNPRYPYKPNVPLTVLVNPVLTFTTDESFLVFEGCLSVPNLRGEVRRRAGVRLQGLDRYGGPLDFTVGGLTAGTFQHETDHLDGTLFVDRVEDTRTLTTWAEFETHHKSAFVKRARGIVARYGG